MADNRNLAALSGNCAADEATYSGDTAVIQLVKPVFVTGAEGSKTVAALEAGGGTEATALRVTLASDSTGVVSVDDNGGSLTVDGTVAATQSGTWNVTNVSGTVSLPTGAATLAEQQTQTTALQLIDDTVATLGTTTYTEATTKGLIIGAVRRDADTTLANTTNEVTPLQVDANGYLKVECFDGGGTHTVDAPVGTPVFVRLSDGSAAITTLPVSLASVPSHAVTNAGTFAVQAAQSGTFTVQPGNTANTTPWLVTPTPATSGGLSTFRSIDIDETEEEIKATAGQVFGWYLTNLATTRRYIKFYNATAASTTVGSTTPFLTIPLDAGQSANWDSTHGITFSTAICVAATTGVADADTGAPGTNDVVGNIFYK